MFDRFSGECYIDRSAEASSTPDIAARENHRTDRTLDGSFNDLDNPLVRRAPSLGNARTSMWLRDPA